MTESYSPPPVNPISVEQHLSRILEAVQPLPPYDQPLLEAMGLPIAEEVAAAGPLPAFDNSSMDGYAVPLQRRGRRLPAAPGAPAGRR